MLAYSKSASRTTTDVLVKLLRLPGELSLTMVQSSLSEDCSSPSDCVAPTDLDCGWGQPVFNKVACDWSCMCKEAHTAFLNDNDPDLRVNGVRSDGVASVGWNQNSPGAIVWKGAAESSLGLGQQPCD